MELFDKKFVYFMWDDKLEGKRGFLSSGIDTLIKMVNQDSDRTAIQKGCERDLPFCKHITVECRLAYYDPNYEVKKAFNEGKKVQTLLSCDVDWRDVENEDAFEQFIKEGRQFRIKPKEEKWIAYLVRSEDGKGRYLTACREDIWEEVQEIYGAKTKLFVGTEEECVEWIKAREKFIEVIKAWEDGKRIQVTPKGTDKWLDLHCEPKWDLRDEYRIKPDCPCEDGIDSKACVGCDKFKKSIVVFKQERRELLEIIQCKDNVIKDLEWQLQEVAKDNDNYQAENKELEKENAELKKRNGELADQKASLERWFGEAKSIIREYVDYPTSNDELWKLHEKAEAFLEEKNQSSF